MNCDFDTAFAKLTGNAPFPWQSALYERFRNGSIPASCDIPTGLGKTSVITIWLLALAHHASVGTQRTFPRRLVYVVNRRTVVDQSTREAERVRNALALRQGAELGEISQALEGLAARPGTSPLAISTLRGQFADNAEWRDDPARAAVVVGTVDMIGSRLLFSGYGRGFKSRPLHAAFLAQDALLVHDEAHLEPAFQQLAESIRREQFRNEWERGRFNVMALSATARSSADIFTISDADRAHPIVERRIRAKKAMFFHEISDEKKFAEKALALALDDSIKLSEKAILIFARQVRDADTLVKALEKGGMCVAALTGTLRGHERDRLAKANRTFARFMPPDDRALGVAPTTGTVYLVCTSAGEVGVNLSADHLICDLTPLDSMAQRLGRVNRFGADPSHVARIAVIAPAASIGVKAGDAFDAARRRTRVLLEGLPELGGGARDASPSTLSALLRGLQPDERAATFSPAPSVLPVTDILFDAWAMTTIRDLPGRPPVQDYLHGVSEYEPPEIYVAWRREVAWSEEAERFQAVLPDPNDLLEDFPLKAHELLRDRADRVIPELVKIAARYRDAIAWVVAQDGNVSVTNLSDTLATADHKRLERELDGCTVVLSPRLGGLANGLLRGDEEFNETKCAEYDVGDEWFDELGDRRRVRTRDARAPSERMRLIRAIDLTRAPEQADDGTGSKVEVWRWYAQTSSADDDGTKNARRPELLTDHLRKAQHYAWEIASHLVDTSEAAAVARAAEWHDLGKNRRVWQRSIGNFRSEVLAKSGPDMRPREITEYRHELGSLLDLRTHEGFGQLTSEQRDLVAHLIAAHHGRARPHFPRVEAFDPERPQQQVAAIVREVPCRFALLQRRYGRWGLAYLESLVRAADALASQDIGATVQDSEAAE